MIEFVKYDNKFISSKTSESCFYPTSLERDSGQFFFPIMIGTRLRLANPDQDVPIANPARTPFGYHRFIANDFHCLLSYCFYVLLV